MPGPCGASRAGVSAGSSPICSRLFLGYQARVQVLAGSSSVRPEITSTNLPGRSGWLCFLCRLAMCFSLEGAVSTGKAVSCVWFSVGGSDRGCAEPGGGFGSGITAQCPPLPFHLRRYVTTTQPHALVLLVSFIQCQDCFKKFPWPQFKQEYSWDVLDFRQSALNLR